MRILLTTEGTYPYVRGGVSTWAHSLVSGLSHHDFTVVAVVANPPTESAYTLTSNARALPVPLWGSELVEEYVPLPRGLRRSRRTTAQAVRRHFLGPFEQLLDELLVVVSDARTIAGTLTELASFAVDYDLRSALRDERVWALVLERLQANPLYLHTSLGEAMDLARSLYRYLMPLTTPLPEVDVVHSSAAAFCVFPGLVAKLRSGTPLILSEHGIYLRERILDLVRNDAHTLGKTMFSNLYRGIGQAAYHFADRVAPVCYYNTGWEAELGVDMAKVQVIFNGADPELFSPGPAPSGPPVITYVGRIDPVKDILSLVRAMRLVHAQIPDAVCRIYGPDTSPEYGSQCREAVRHAGLDAVISFKGPTQDPASAYRAADIVVLSSMSEGFPFSVVEAMMCARTVVATNVGGVPEALEDPLLLAPPQGTPALAATLVRQLERPRAQREALGAELREKALARFTRAGFLAAYDQLYQDIDDQLR